jgi:hypothetical protein
VLFEGFQGKIQQFLLFFCSKIHALFRKFYYICNKYLEKMTPELLVEWSLYYGMYDYDTMLSLAVTLLEFNPLATPQDYDEFLEQSMQDDGSL